MKALIVLWLLVGGFSPASTRFLGMPWNLPKSEVIEKFEKKIGFDPARHQREDPDVGVVLYQNVWVNGILFREARLSFDEKGFDGFSLGHSTTSLVDLDSAYHQLRRILTEEHGKPTYTDCANYFPESIMRKSVWRLDSTSRSDKVVLSIEFSKYMEWYGNRGFDAAMREGGMFGPGADETTPCDEP